MRDFLKSVFTGSWWKESSEDEKILLRTVLFVLIIDILIAVLLKTNVFEGIGHMFDTPYPNSMPVEKFPK